MAILYIGNTALEFWRWYATVRASTLRPKRCRITKVPPGSPSPPEVIAGCEDFMHDASVAEVMVCDRRHIRKSNNVRYEVYSQSFPQTSFYMLNKGMYVASPEFVLMQMARSLQLPELLLCCNELTGKFAFTRDSIRGWCQVIEPITSEANISRFLKAASGLRGAKALGDALKYVVPNCASPMESEIALVLSLPKRHGGYGIEKPSMNYELPMDDDIKRILHRQSITVDFAWPDKKLAIEYESDEWHSGEMKFREDSERRNKIRQLGYDVTTITSKEYASTTTFDLIADDIRKKLHQGKRPEPQDYYFLKSNLRRMLMKARTNHPE